MTGPLERVFCEACGKEIIDPEDLVVFTRYLIGGVRVNCVNCFGRFAKSGRFKTETHVILNSLTVPGLTVLSLLYGTVIGLLIWFAYLASQPFVQKGPGVDLALAVFLVVVVLSYVKLMYQRWFSWVHYEIPLRQRAKKP